MFSAVVIAGAEDGGAIKVISIVDSQKVCEIVCRIILKMDRLSHKDVQGNLYNLA